VPVALAPGTPVINRDQKGGTEWQALGRPRRRDRAGVVPHVVIERNNATNLDGAAGRVGRFDLKTTVLEVSGREFAEFGTVSPGFKSRAPDQIGERHSRVVLYDMTVRGRSRVTEMSQIF
jgi:hypothetical protein